MADELVERLLDWPYQGETMAHEAAARIEQLTAERDEAWAYMSALQGDLYDAIMIKAERDRLREALRGLERASTEVASCGTRTGPQWLKLTVANLSARAALKGETT